MSKEKLQIEYNDKGNVSIRLFNSRPWYKIAWGYIRHYTFFWRKKGEWIYIAHTYDGDKGTTYINGVDFTECYTDEVEGEQI